MQLNKCKVQSSRAVEGGLRPDGHLFDPGTMVAVVKNKASKAFP